MKVGGGKRKGSAFERVVAKDIVKAFRRMGVTQRDCWRSINSGGHVIACGDLEMSEKLMGMFPFAVECKHRRKIRWQNFLMRGHSEEMAWLRQAKEGAKKLHGLKPILVMKENFGPAYVLDARFDYPGDMQKWTMFLKNAVKEVNNHKANART